MTLNCGSAIVGRQLPILERGGDFLRAEVVIARDLLFDRPATIGRSEVGDQPGGGAATEARHSCDQRKPALSGIDQMVPHRGLIDPGTARGVHRDQCDLAFPRRGLDQRLVGTAQAIQRFDQGFDRAVERFFLVDRVDHLGGSGGETTVGIRTRTERNRDRVGQRPGVAAIEIA